MITMINIREYPHLFERAADYFSSKWKIDRKLYIESIDDSISTKKPVPRWYLMLRDDKIIGGFGLIENDFMVRTDLCPWLCALYIEPSERGQQLGAKLLAHGRCEAAKLGFDKVYLNTDHVGYYEKYDWRYTGSFAHKSGVETRVYEADSIRGIEEMSSFFNARADSYDSHMLGYLGLDDFYDSIANCFDKPIKHLLDLGCGTGLELERLFLRFPDMNVTGIDMSTEMLKKLELKYPDKSLRLICGSYFDEDFGGTYDCILSTYSLHHFSEDEKLALYRKINAALQWGGVFVFGDYTVSTIERQQELIAANDEKRREQGIPEGEFYHFDIPFTPDTEMRLMKNAGFVDVEVIRKWDNTCIIIAKRDDCVGSVYGNIRRDKKYINNLLDFIRQEYNLEPVNISPAKRGYYGETWRLDTAEHSYFLKLDYSGVHKHLYERSLPVVEHLATQSINFISRIVKTTDGRLSAIFDGAIIGVFDWIDGDNIQNEETKRAEFKMLAQIYNVPVEGVSIPCENFLGSSAELFFNQWDAIDDIQIRTLFEENRTKLEYRAERLKQFAALCKNDMSGFVITHGDAGGNVIMNGNKFYIVDWDDPILAPPERDAWFCLHLDWAIDIFNRELNKNGIDYILRPERLAYYCYHSFFFYMTEYLSTYFEIGNRGGNMAQKLCAYFNCWIEDEIQYADKSIITNY